MEAWLDGCPPKEDGYLKFIRRHRSCPPEEDPPLAEKPEII